MSELLQETFTIGIPFRFYFYNSKSSKLCYTTHIIYISDNL